MCKVFCVGGVPVLLDELVDVAVLLDALLVVDDAELELEEVADDAVVLLLVELVELELAELELVALELVELVDPAADELLELLELPAPGSVGSDASTSISRPSLRPSPSVSGLVGEVPYLGSSEFGIPS